MSSVSRIERESVLCGLVGHGIIIALILAVTDKFSIANHAQSEVLTLHGKTCSSLESISGAAGEDEVDIFQEKGGVTYSIMQAPRDGGMEEVIGPLSSCDCDATMEVLFKRSDGSTLWMSSTLEELKHEIPLFRDEDAMRTVLGSGVSSPLCEMVVNGLMVDMAPLFVRLADPMRSTRKNPFSASDGDNMDPRVEA
mgnify:CR=1 FL=1